MNKPAILNASPDSAGKYSSGRRPSRGRNGFALIAVLIILAMLALLGVTSMKAANTEIQISANVEDSARSFEAGDAGLSAAATLLLAEPDVLDFTGAESQLDFSAAEPNPLAHLSDDTPTSRHNDLPTVTARESGDPEGNCSRAEGAWSEDQIDCEGYEVVSTHAPVLSAGPRGRATTTLRMGVERPIIAR